MASPTTEGSQVPPTAVTSRSQLLVPILVLREASRGHVSPHPEEAASRDRREWRSVGRRFECAGVAF